MTRHGVTEYLKAFEDVTTVFFDAESDLLIALDVCGNISRVNPAFTRVLGRDEHDVIGMPIIQLVHIDDWARFIRSFSLMAPVHPFRLLHRDSGAVAVEMIAFRFKHADEGRKGYLILRPIGNAGE